MSNNDILDNIISKVKNAADVACKKTDEVMEKSKLMWTRNQITGDIKKTYEKLGNVIYRSIKTDNENVELVEEYIKQIDGLLAQLTQINEKIAELKNQIICKNCGMLNPVESVYCSKCGYKLSDDAENETEAAQGDKDAGAGQETAQEDASSEDEASSNEE